MRGCPVGSLHPGRRPLADSSRSPSAPVVSGQPPLSPSLFLPFCGPVSLCPALTSASPAAVSNRERPARNLKKGGQPSGRVFLFPRDKPGSPKVSRLGGPDV